MKSRDPSAAGQFRRGTAPPVIRLTLGTEVSKWFGAEVFGPWFGHFGTSFVVLKCLVAEVSGSRQ